MGLETTQQVLAQLYTNTELRERFFANPQAVGLEMGLNCDEAQQLAQLSAQQVNVFANSLKWKRLGEVRELLPRTAKEMGKNFTTLFWRYAETPIPQGMKKHRQDAIAFANFIIQVTQTEGIEPAYIGDLVRYEKTWLLTYDSAICWRICWFGYAIHQDFSKKPAIAIWLRLGKRSQLRHFVL
ncbi:hypothetical protein [Anabaena sp. CCY 9402-a]|uniref:hypothetical protein n=1 Tax=Anabaena sp. CCY 9402-a TaxID=3103867 RepID=UPI0039C6DABE